MVPGERMTRLCKREQSRTNLRSTISVGVSPIVLRNAVHPTQPFASNPHLHRGGSLKGIKMEATTYATASVILFLKGVERAATLQKQALEAASVQTAEA